ncbi:glycosyltransferase family 2 protein [Lonepinella sp. BR2357]|uniref:glycosyltransferase family 2 protein n=1 Tax=Lonepinella sp. BR2357 TaxID=3434549 RepID=UPI003F6DC3A0
MANFRPVAVIPHYNHANSVGAVVHALRDLGLAVIIIDDGSTEIQRSKLATYADQADIYYCDQNGGKGAALKVGLRYAQQQGFSHALQVDADGQHNLTDVQAMLERAEQSPNAIICGLPIYGEDAPKARLYGRKITNFWLAVNTLSTDIKDGMCGFRCYPLDAVVPLLDRFKVGDRMDFDIELLVYAHWQQIALQWLSTQVQYPTDGVSHFHAWQDNLRISRMHARLFFGMLRRLLTGQPL